MKSVPSCRRKFHGCQLGLKQCAARIIAFFSFCFLWLAENCYICFHHCTTRIIRITNEIHQHKPKVFTYNYFWHVVSVKVFIQEMARLRRKDHKYVTVLHPWGAPRLDLSAVFYPETSPSHFCFRRRNQTFIFKDKLNVFFDRANNWLLREKRFYGATLFYLFRGAKSCLYS